LVQIDEKRALYWCRTELVAELPANSRRSAVAGAVLEARQLVIPNIRGTAQIKVMALAVCQQHRAAFRPKLVLGIRLEDVRAGVCFFAACKPAVDPAGDRIKDR
jgi:hypothetical protein